MRRAEPSDALPVVAHDSPPWLGSLVLHLAVLIVLALVMTGAPSDRGPLLWTMLSGETLDPGGSAAVADFKSAAGSASSAAEVFTPQFDLVGARTVDPWNLQPNPLAGLEGLEDLNLAGGGRTGSGMGTGQGSGRGAGQASLFGIRSAGRKFIYVVDRSASMRDRNLLDLAKKEVAESLNKLRPDCKFQVIFYNEEPLLFNPHRGPDRFITATKGNIYQVRRFLDTIHAFDGTNHQQALLRAIRMRPDVIFLWTDAQEPALEPPELQRIHAEANGIVINAIEVGFGPQADPENFLVQLARQNRGQHTYLDIDKLMPR